MKDTSFDKDVYGIHNKDIRFINKNNKNNNFIYRVNNGLLKLRDWKLIKEIATEIYNEVNENNLGKTADYIPQLKKMDDNKFTISIVSVDGQVFELGDTHKKFCVQSCSKPITYAIAVNEQGDEIVHNFVGKEPSGKNFNELCLNDDGLPHNPLINAGSIMTTSLIDKDKNIYERFEKVYNYWKMLVLEDNLSFNNSVYLSEKDSADRNYCLGYMLQESGAFEFGKDKNISKSINRSWSINDLKTNLELYFQFCSLETNILGAGLLAATLANNGVHPWSYNEIFKKSTVKNTLSLMHSCGMYDYSGEWNYDIGIPAKSGVSGLIYGIIPGVCGIATYSPRLDKIGNSYRGVNFFKKLSKKINMHIFDQNNPDLISLKNIDINNKKIIGFLLLQACKDRNLNLIRECLSKGCDINFKD